MIEYNIRDKLILKTSGKYMNDDVVIKCLPAEPAIPEITFDQSTGIATATIEGLEDEELKTYTSSYQIPILEGDYEYDYEHRDRIIIPKGVFIKGSHIIKGDNNLVASNIRKGISLFGINGTFDPTSTAKINNAAFLIKSEISKLEIYENPLVTTITSGYFRANTRWAIPVRFVNCTDVKSYAFEFAYSIPSVEMPSLSIINDGVFRSCYALKTVSFPNVTVIGPYAFYACSSLSSIYFPLCSKVEGNAFYKCSKIETLDLPNCSYIGAAAFYTGSLTSISLPNCLTISNTAFYNNPLTVIDLPRCSVIGHSAFQNCPIEQINLPECIDIGTDAFKSAKIQILDLPKCSTIRGPAFEYCSNLKEVNLPMVEGIAAACFLGCFSLEKISSMPYLRYFYTGVFSNCNKLSKIDIGSSNTVGSIIYPNTFRNCTSLEKVILRYNNVIQLSGSNAFQNTPIELSTLTGKFGSIYVPSDLVTAYQGATNWTLFSSRITAILEEDL